MKRKICSLALIILLVLSLCPVHTFASGLEYDTTVPVSITIKAPQVDEHPDFNPAVTVPDGFYFEVTDVIWKITDSTVVLDAASTFQVNICYQVTVYIATSDPDVRLEGEINGDKEFTYNTGQINGIYDFTYYFRVLRPIEMSTVSIVINAPSAGASADYTPLLPSGAKYLYDSSQYSEYSLNGVWWYDNTTGDNLAVASPVFTEGHEYKVRIYLYAKTGYAFSDYTGATVNGHSADCMVGNDWTWVMVEYTFPAAGTIQGWQNIGGKYYYYRDGAAVTGWQVIDGKYFYFNPAGVLQTGFVQIDGKYYYFSKATGVLQTGFVKNGGKFYYFDKTNGALRTGIVKDGSKYYYFDKISGVLKTGFVKDGGKYYYFSKTDGTMQFGFVQVSNDYYYYFSKADGTMQFNIVKIDGDYYFFSPTLGYLMVGWMFYKGKHYYFSPTTGKMQFGWLNYNGYLCYLDPATGACAIDTELEIGGVIYTFNSMGYVINSRPATH